MAVIKETDSKQLIQEASSFITQNLIRQQQHYCLQFLCHFRVLDFIPLPPQSISYVDVAAKANVPVTRLKAIARMAMTAGFLCETVDGHLSHNPLSGIFVQNEHLRIQLYHMVEQTIPLMAAFTRATEIWGETKVPNQTAYNISAKTNLPFFEHLKSDPDISSEFDSYMKSQAVVNSGAKVEHLLRAFDWESLKEGATVVDVGGGSGATAVTLATAHPKLRVVIQDLPAPIGNARAFVGTLPKDVSGRIELQEHDMFKEQPMKNADVYLLRTIIHDWPDEEAIAILRRVVAAMGPQSHLAIMDMVLPIPGTESPDSEAALRQKDLAMIQTFNAKEREMEQWLELIKLVDTRIYVREVRRPEGAQHSVLDVTFRENVAIN
ncbi:fusarubin cluster-methyltransferase [Stemphylium lycopersici]|uniref:Fusarubin cluster-methyltransferase n=1 Tax=Stemphylium lycopersici TaxID=183478 RepID=A0A364MVQ2_STELY|nr:fusarubin cluster-methyltransferase [Stemphylium lycopersici]RAQ99286.1 fusarubin cluster-methyltransferase [Stemphylium lycopersici]RAR04285.1 fusarubin cluster-methyltransferase [Stemphylium lycopersici]